LQTCDCAAFEGYALQIFCKVCNERVVLNAESGSCGASVCCGGGVGGNGSSSRNSISKSELFTVAGN